MKYVTDEQQERLFLDACSPEQVLEYQNLLGSALEEYSQDPSLNPPRMVSQNPHGTTILHMPISSDAYNGIKTLAYNPQVNLGFVGNVSCLNKKTGELEGIVSAKVLTGFRTALASCIGLQKVLETLEWNHPPALDLMHSQDHLKNIQITVLGSGLQAFWHIVIAIKNLLVYKSAVSNIQINIFYRRNRMSDENVAKILNQGNIVQVTQYKHDIDNGTDSEDGLISEKISKSDIIFGCTPSIHPTLKFKYFQKLTMQETVTRTGFFKKNKVTYISLIGSYKPEMHEADNDFMQFFTENGKQNIIVDSTEQVLIEAGEFIDSNVQPQSLVEIGKLIKSQSPVPTVYSKDLDRSFVFCKLVGLAVMDISVAQHIIASI